MEPLEERQVLTTLIIDAGTAGNDQIDISGSGSNLTVLRNGTEIFSGAVSAYDFVQVNAADGDDTIDLLSLPIGSGGTAEVMEQEANDTHLTAQELPAAWSIVPDQNINRDDATPTNDPHVTVHGTYDGTHDVYHFQVTVGTGEFVTGYFDIDEVDQNQFDSYLELLDADGNVIPFAEGDDAPFPDLNAGSDPYNLNGDTYDALFGFVFPEGTHDYYIRVKESPFPGVALGSNPSYDLQVVVSNYNVGGGPPPGIIVNGGDGSDTLNVAAGLMPLSAVDENVLEVGPVPFSGTLLHGAAEVVEYTNVETFNGGAAYTVLTDLVALGKQNGSADNTFVRPDLAGTKLLVDVNGVPYFTGGISQILIAAVNGSTDADTITVQNTVIAAHVDGGDGDDTITTSSGPDIVYGGGGNDNISTNSGNDYVSGGTGNDMISSNSGQDRLYGNDGDDTLVGGADNDLLSGGSGIDLLTGGAGRDVIIGGLGGDIAFGNGDRDLFFASGATNGQAGIDGDSDMAFDANDTAMLQLLADWGNLLAINFTSTGNDGALDLMLGGAGDDEIVGDGSFIFLE